MNKIIRSSCVVIFIYLLLSVTTKAYDLENLLTAPYDSLDAQSIQIWVPVEKVRTTNISIKIYTSRGATVRMLYEGPLPKGYHYFYWDKLNDSGRYVPEGNYTYRVKFSYRRPDIFRSLKVSYIDGGDAAHLKLLDDILLPGINFEILKDSTLVSLDILTAKGKPYKSIIADSVFDSGNFEYQLKKEDSLRTGKYLFQFKVGDYIYRKLFYNKLKRHR